ncbi:Rmi2 [Columba guinea]|nr:Rmi2 [Columba guinea]
MFTRVFDLAELSVKGFASDDCMNANCPCCSLLSSTGNYVMVMGVVRSCSPEPVLRAIKMTDLSENPVHKNMWSLEVEDLHRVIP